MWKREKNRDGARVIDPWRLLPGNGDKNAFEPPFFQVMRRLEKERAQGGALFPFTIEDQGHWR